MLAIDICEHLALKVCDLACTSCRDELHTHAHALYRYLCNKDRAKG